MQTTQKQILNVLLFSCLFIGCIEATTLSMIEASMHMTANYDRAEYKFKA